MADRLRSTYSPRPAGRQNIAVAIINELKSDIASGKLALGERLPTEPELASQFGVSQPTVREAIRALDAMGLIETRHGSGMFVTRDVHGYMTNSLKTLVQMENVGILDALDVREMLGVYSARQAAERATEQDLEEIDAAEELCDTAQDVEGMTNAIAAFQIAVSAASHNPLLFAVEAYLIRVTIDFQLVAEGDKDTAFWRQRTSSFSEARHHLATALHERDQEAAIAAMTRYLAKQREWWSADRELADVRFSDPELIRLR